MTVRERGKRLFGMATRTREQRVHNVNREREVCNQRPEAVVSQNQDAADDEGRSSLSLVRLVAGGGVQSRVSKCVALSEGRDFDMKHSRKDQISYQIKLQELRFGPSMRRIQAVTSFSDRSWRASSHLCLTKIPTCVAVVLFNDVVVRLHGPVLHPMNSLLLLLLLPVQEPNHLLAALLPIFTTLFLFSAVFEDERKTVNED